MYLNGDCKVKSDCIVDIFYFFSETVSQIYFKLDGDVPWAGPYYALSTGHCPVIFGFFISFFIFLFLAKF